MSARKVLFFTKERVYKLKMLDNNLREIIIFYLERDTCISLLIKKKKKYFKCASFNFKKLFLNVCI